MSVAKLAPLIGNKLSYPAGKPYAAILGASPSKGARSPVLWNAAFKAHGVDAQMLPMDVTPEGLPALLEALAADKDFMGGAVAMPHKEAVAAWLGQRRLSPEAARIGAVNCLYRRDDGTLKGTNTDGEGAVVALENRYGSMRGKRALQLGLGGAGKAVAAYLAVTVVPGGRLMVSTRRKQAKEAEALDAAEWVEWDRLPSMLGRIDILVNTTSVGAGKTAGESPLSEEVMARLPSRAIVYDIIYQPSPTKFLQLAGDRRLKTLDGGAMNLEQAVLGYGYAAPEPRGRSKTRAAMEAAKRALDAR